MFRVESAIIKLLRSYVRRLLGRRLSVFPSRLLRPRRANRVPKRGSEGRAIATQSAAASQRADQVALNAPSANAVLKKPNRPTQQRRCIAPSVFKTRPAASCPSAAANVLRVRSIGSMQLFLSYRVPLQCLLTSPRASCLMVKAWHIEKFRNVPVFSCRSSWLQKTRLALVIDDNSLLLLLSRSTLFSRNDLDG